MSISEKFINLRHSVYTAVKNLPRNTAKAAATLNGRTYIAAFVFPFLLMMTAYAMFKVYPFGENSLLGLDLNAQYIYYYAHMKDVLAGNASLVYSWERNLSGEFFGIIGYYAASPFNFIMWAFPLEHITEGLFLMTLTKLGACGVCMAVFLRYRGVTPVVTVIFSTCYALTSYNMEQTLNPMWFDGVMILPVIALATERLCRKGRFKLMVISLAYAFITCFYIGYMLAIFAFLYFVVYMLASRKINGDNIPVMLKRLALFALCGVTAGLLSAFMLLPVVNGLSMGKFTFSNPDFSIANSFDLLSALSKLLPNSYDTVRMTGKPFLYCGTLAVILLPCYFFLKSVNFRRKLCVAGLMFFLLFCMYVRPVDMVWHGFQMPNWLPFRYSFALSFLFLVLAAKTLDRIGELRPKVVAFSLLFWGLLYAFFDTQDFNIDRGEKKFDYMAGASVIIPAVLILAVYGTLLLVKQKRVAVSPTVRMALVILIGAELVYNGYTSVWKQSQDVGYVKRTTFVEQIMPMRYKADEMRRNDPSFYRSEKDFYRGINDPMALNMYGVTHSSSMLNANAIELLKRMGFTARSHMSRYSGSTPLTDDLFGFKYIFSCLDNNAGNVKTAADINVEYNDDTMPIIYLTDNAIKSVILGAEDALANQCRVLKSMLGEPDEGAAEYYYTRLVPDEAPELQNMEYERVSEGYDRYTKTGSGTDVTYSVTWYMTADHDGEAFMYMPSVYERKVDVFVGGKNIGPYYETNDYNIKSLGVFNEGDSIVVQLRPQKDKIFFLDAGFFQLRDDNLKADIAKLHKINENTVFTAQSETHLTVTTNADVPRTLFTTIPDEPGWTVTMDGKPVEYHMALDALMAVDAPAGAHTFEFKFTPAYYPFAPLLSLSGIVVFVCMINAAKRKDGVTALSSVYTTDEFDAADTDTSDDNSGYAARRPRRHKPSRFIRR